MSTPAPLAISEPAPLLTVTDLTVLAGSSVLVDGVSLRIEQRERVGIIGASGSGKSLTCMAITQLLPEGLTATGTVAMDGEPGNLLTTTERRLARLRGRRTGMVFQEPMTALNPTMRVGRQVAEVLRLHGMSAREARAEVQELLTVVGLPDPQRIGRSYPHQLSGGQRQRVVIAIAMANRPDLLICDEPTTALDVTVQATVLDLIDRRAEAAESALLFISHDLAVVARVCDRVLVMYGGQIVEQGPVTEVLTNPQHEHTRRLLADADLGGERKVPFADAGGPS
jgi:ABC-type dipeptide/oligopeptide/nickel transport system ATPase component